MRRKLRLTAVLLALAAIGWWSGAGFNRGFTKTSVAVPLLDEVTGIEGVDYEPRFVPGLDFLGVSAAGASLLAGASFLFRKRKTEPQH